MTLVTTRDRVIVRPVEGEKKTASGFYIPDSSVEKPSQGDVVYAGPGRIATATGALIPMSVQVGDRVLFAAGAGLKTKIDGEELTVLVEDDIIAIIKE